MTQGFSRGHEQGKAEGKAEGMSEGKIQVAKALLSKGMTKELIAEVTGMSLKELENLG